ncbi:MAG: hypothetical protein QGG36_19540 [Pirellulaceae bacterium]|jgi:hypothetical protein|nr:hypothetical protein [Pirellulaceae bacterium]MDP7018007.1 hypothetical protein [Pirellulaceae bacterium]
MKSPHRWPLASIVIAIATANATAGYAQTVSPLLIFHPKERETFQKEAALDEKLKQPVRGQRLTIEGLPAWLQRFGVKAIVDERALDDIGIGVKRAIRMPGGQLSLRAHLDLIARGNDLACVNRDGILRITTPEENDLKLATRLYDVSSIVSVERWRGETTIDYDTLIELLTTTVSPETWEYVGGAGAVEGYIGTGRPILVVSQTVDVHVHVLRLLETLTLASGRNPTLDRRRLPRRRQTLGAFVSPSAIRRSSVRVSHIVSGR